MLSDMDDTICALATPPGTGGIGVIRLSGTRAFPVADAATRNASSTPCKARKGHTLHRANIVNAHGDTIDSALLAVYHAPRSYTGEDTVEIMTHGGPVPLRQTIARLLECGARLAHPGEFTLRAYMNGKLDLAQAEAVADIIAARTDESHALAQRQGRGALSEAVGDVREIILGVLARIEASIDFPEDVGDLDTALALEDINDAITRIDTLLATADRGILIREGASIALIGKPNVGKSSLLNALLRTARAIVTPIPGTTRDVIEETLNLRGIPLRAIDTAGLRETNDPLEQMGIQRTRDTIARADFLLIVRDVTDREEDRERGEGGPHPPAPSPNTGRGGANRKGPPALQSAVEALRPGPIMGSQNKTMITPHSVLLPIIGAGGPLWDTEPGSEGHPIQPPDTTLLSHLTDRPHLIVWNKCDLVPGFVPPDGIAISAATGENIDTLETAIAEALMQAPAIPNNAPAVTHARHKHALQTAKDSLTAARETVNANLPPDFLSIDIRGALTALGQITGETTPDSIIEEIFSRFCIGK